MNKKSSSIKEIANNEKGALLLSLIIIIVVFAVLGAFLLSITSTSTFTQVYSNNATKAYYMAESGFRYATMNIVTIGKGGKNCLKCHSSHGKETIRYSAGYTTLPDDMIRIHGETYPRDDQDILDGGKFTVRLAPFWFEAESLVGNNLTVSAVKTSGEFVGEPIQCDFPEIFTDNTIAGGGLYIGDQYVVYESIDALEFAAGTLIFQNVAYPDGSTYTFPAEKVDVFPACLAAEQLAIKPGDDLLINATAAELDAFPDTKSVIEIHSMNADGSPVKDSDDKPVTHLVSYDNVDVDNRKFIGLGNVSNDVSQDVFGATGLEVSDDIVVLSKTLKITSTGVYSEAEKTLVYYRWVGRPMAVPIVYNTAKPDEGKLLAGGNFYWVSDVGGNDDAMGHNIFSDNGDDELDSAPGDTENFAPCFTNSCHKNLNLPFSSKFPPYIPTPVPELAEFEGKYGCESCHISDHETKSSCLVTDAPWYRFLSGGHNAEQGVNGIEHENWNYDATASSHNEYLGNVFNSSYGFSLGNTTTAFCTGCHVLFHKNQRDGNNLWIRHPSDWVIKDNEKFADAFKNDDGIRRVYDPNVPVARDNLIGVSNEVMLGSDMVMCLSCHVAHGSQYPDMLRWNYDNMIVGTQGNGHGKGCFKCHTDKDKADYYTEDDERHCYDCHTMHDSQDNVCATPTSLKSGLCDGAYPQLLKNASPPTCPHKKQ